MGDTKITKLFTTVKDKLFFKVKDIVETDSYEDVNKMIHENWILLNIVSNSGKLIYSLGKVIDL